MQNVSIIDEYDPNFRWGKQHVEIVLKQWQYEATVVELVGGNCFGMSVMECAISNLYDRLEGMPLARIMLTAPDGSTLLCEDEDDRGEDWLQDMVVSVRIIACDPPVQAPAEPATTDPT